MKTFLIALTLPAAVLAQESTESSDSSGSPDRITALQAQVEALSKTVASLQKEINSQQHRWEQFNAPAAATLTPASAPASASTAQTAHHRDHHHHHDHHGSVEGGASPLPYGLEISGVVDFITSYSQAADQINFTPRDVELEVSATVDPYARAWITLNAHSELDPTADVDPFEHTSVHLEEAAIATTSLPWGLTLKGGQFFADFTLHGKTHGHALPFVDRPFSLSSAIGGETISRGFELSWQALPRLRFTVGAVDGMGETLPLTNRLINGEEEGHEGHSHGGDAVFGQWRNRAPRSLMIYGRAAGAIEPTPFTLLELGANYAQADGKTQRQIASADARFTWQPNGLKPDQLELGAEVIWSRQQGPFSDAALSHLYHAPDDHDDHDHHDHGDHHESESVPSNVVTSTHGSATVRGGYAWLQYRIGHYWVPGVRLDYTRSDLYGLDGEHRLSRVSDRRLTGSTYLTWLISDSQRMRLQFSYVDAERALVPSGKKHDLQAFLQWTVLLGSHNHDHP